LRPGLAVCTDTHGELGVRHQETVAVTEEGCENLAPQCLATLATSCDAAVKLGRERLTDGRA
jgi:hypothetical protein